MLTRLSIRDMLLIERLDLTFDGALNVLTGETGAGKSILLDSLGFVLGWRGRADLVRTGAKQGEVEAEFELSKSHPVAAILDDAGIEFEAPLIIRRINSADGRKRGFINDRAVSGDLLRKVGSLLVEMHGQHDDKGLLDERSHQILLDEYGDIDTRPMAAAYSTWRTAKKALAEHLEQQAKIEADAEFIRHAADELSKLAPEVGEEVKLDEKRRLMQKGEALTSEFGDVLMAMGEHGMGSQLSQILRCVRGLAEKMGDAIEPALVQIETAYDQLSDAETMIARLAEASVFDANVLEQTEERLFAIRAAARKYGVTSDELPATGKDFQTKLETLHEGSGATQKLVDAEAQALITAQAEAKNLTARREEAGRGLDQQILGELAPLKMENARFMTEVSTVDMNSKGHDQIRFVVQTNPGSPAGSISKIASGGELSRFLLALKICLHQEGAEISMIFDEIDRGVGGQTADAVGRRLRMLATSAQLLVVTHSPQVAAMGQRHFQVSKDQRADATLTSVLNLSHDERANEIARMISGDHITPEALVAAQKLLETADG